MSELPQIPGYTTLKEVGRGGVARVYLARDKSLDREVAIKMMSLSKFADNSLSIWV
jgi:serine/threonine protein kinase